MKYLSKTLALVLVFLLAFSSFNLVAFAAAAEDVTALEAEEDYIPGFLERLKGLVDLIRNFIDSIKNFVFGLLGIVKPIPVRSVGLNKLFLLLQVGESEQLIATVYPDVATNKDVIWSSSDESIAVVDQNGLVTAAGSGIASITVTTVDGRKTASVTVFVGDALVLPSGSIQAAIDAADAGDVIFVISGTYKERLTVNKPLTIWGLNYDTDGDGDRIYEVFVTYPDGLDTSDLTLLNVSADNVVIKGLTFINEQETAGSAKELSFTGENIEFANNRVIVKANKTALYFGSDSTAPNARGGVVVRANYIEAAGTALHIQGIGAVVEENEITGGTALKVEPKANSAGGSVQGNTLNAFQNGIVHSSALSGSGQWKYDDNTVTAAAAAGVSGVWTGISLSSAEASAVFTGNTVDGTTAVNSGAFDEVIGIHFAGVISGAAAFAFSGNAVSGVSLGALKESGSADLNAIFADNTFPEGSMVIGNEIKVPTWADFADTSWYNAALSEYDISTAEQLAGLSALVASGINFNGKTLNLINDIDLQNIEWIPIGDGSRWFGGIFNGNGYKITGLKITDNTLANVGLFGYVRGAGDTAGIRNLTVSGKIDIAGSKVFSPNVGILAGLVWGFVENCHTTSVKEENTISFKSECGDSGQHRVALGGLVGWNANSNYPHNGMADSSFTGTINVETETPYVPGVGGNSGAYVGGLLGMANRVNVVDSFAHADITANAYRYLSMGGIMGYSMGEKTRFENLEFDGNLNGCTDMTGDSNYSTCSVQIGGILGSGEFAGASAPESGFVNCTAKGALNADIDGEGASVYTGGIVGYVYPYWREPYLAYFGIEGCEVDLLHNVDLDTPANIYTGGLAGIIYNDASAKTTISLADSEVKGAINVSNTAAGTGKRAYIGGLFGYGLKNNTDPALNAVFSLNNCTAVAPTVSLDYDNLKASDMWGKIEWAEAAVNNVYYSSWLDAVSALQEGGTFTFTAEQVTIDRKVMFRKNNITIRGIADINGKPMTTIKGVGNSVEQFRIEGYNVTLRDLNFDSIANGGGARENNGVYFYYPNNIWAADRVNYLINCHSTNTYWAIFSGIKLNAVIEDCTFENTNNSAKIYMDRPYDVTIRRSFFKNDDSKFSLHIDNGTVGGNVTVEDCVFVSYFTTAGDVANTTGAGNITYTFRNCDFYTNSGVEGSWCSVRYANDTRFIGCRFHEGFEGIGAYPYEGGSVFVDSGCAFVGGPVDISIYYGVGAGVLAGVNVQLDSEGKVIGGTFKSDPTAYLADGYTATLSGGVWIVG
ncbi:MAG: hypothetical protein GXY95_03820 [Clostridiales bacterium]|jgi:hypothetical protein|nr:hypothetical protein [Clostridiales bacterium]